MNNDEKKMWIYEQKRQLFEGFYANLLPYSVDVGGESDSSLVDRCVALAEKTFNSLYAD